MLLELLPQMMKRRHRMNEQKIEALMKRLGVTEQEAKKLIKREIYWGDRAAKTQAMLTTKNIKTTNNQLQKYYVHSMWDVIGQFEKTYNKLISRIEEGKQPTPADLYKLDKYWQMQGQLKQELTKLGYKQAALLSKRFTEHYIGVYEALAMKDDTTFNVIDRKSATQMINQIWCADGKSWSSRIWDNVNKLQQRLNDSLIECVLTGKKTSELKKILQNDFAIGYSQADSLVRTEMAHIQTKAAEQRYKDYGIQEVEILADKDERRCKICGKLHQKRYKLGEAVPIPAHPRCRCCIIPVVE